jgi:16S rRNA (guanine966-N2)-methyltransferase
MTLRIISGQWRGRNVQTPKGGATRPTADRTREALFSMLVSRMGSFEGLHVADLFAGSGALGLEALSRRAASCLFVEQDRFALNALRTNIAALGAGGQSDVMTSSVLNLGPAKRDPLDLIFMDPPYDSGAGVVAMEKMARLGWIGPATLISLETAKAEDAAPKGYDCLADRSHGKARLRLFRLAPTHSVP